MSTFVRWAIVIVSVLVVLGLIAYARGPEHRRGDEVGALVHPLHVPTSSTS